MKNKIIPSIFVVSIIMYSYAVLSAGDNKKNSTAVVEAPKDVKTELRIKDSTAYFNLQNDNAYYTFQNTPNEIILSNGMKITFLKMTRFSIPRGVAVNIPDDNSLRYTYELAELTLKATNSTNHEVKFDASEAVLVSVKLYSQENSYKAYTSQYSISLGSIYLKTEPAQPERMKKNYDETTAFLHQSYNAGQTKSCSGLVIPISKSAKKIDKIVVTVKEFGQNISYGCPLDI